MRLLTGDRGDHVLNAAEQLKEKLNRLYIEKQSFWQGLSASELIAAAEEIADTHFVYTSLLDSLNNEETTSYLLQFDDPLAIAKSGWEAAKNLYPREKSQHELSNVLREMQDCNFGFRDFPHAGETSNYETAWLARQRLFGSLIAKHDNWLEELFHRWLNDVMQENNQDIWTKTENIEKQLTAFQSAMHRSPGEKSWAVRYADLNLSLLQNKYTPPLVDTKRLRKAIESVSKADYTLNDLAFYPPKEWQASTRDELTSELDDSIEQVAISIYDLFIGLPKERAVFTANRIRFLDSLCAQTRKLIPQMDLPRSSLKTLLVIQDPFSVLFREYSGFDMEEYLKGSDFSLLEQNFAKIIPQTPKEEIAF